MDEVNKGMNTSELLEAHNAYIKNLSDDKFETVLNKRANNLQVVLDRLHDAFPIINEGEETLSEVIAEKYGLNENDFDKAVEVEMFEERLSKIIQTLIPSEDEKEDNEEDF